MSTVTIEPGTLRLDLADRRDRKLLRLLVAKAQAEGLDRQHEQEAATVQASLLGSRRTIDAWNKEMAGRELRDVMRPLVFGDPSKFADKPFQGVKIGELLSTVAAAEPPVVAGRKPSGAF